jgi:hypothetical protein
MVAVAFPLGIFFVFSAVQIFFVWPGITTQLVGSDSAPVKILLNRAIVTDVGELYTLLVLKKLNRL